MSDLSISLEALERSRFQLLGSSYFDEDLFRREQALIFQPPRYLGHELMVPEVGDYLALAQEGEGRALVRTAQGVELVSNVCRHRQAVMLKGRGNTGGQVVCPLHRWTYDLDGKLLGAPHFVAGSLPEPAQLPGAELEGLLFEGNGRDVPADLAALGPGSDLDFSGFVFTPTCTSATTTGRPSSRSTWRTTTSGPSIRVWGSSSPVTTCAGNSAGTTRYRRWA
jgi:choline monooxygenase